MFLHIDDVLTSEEIESIKKLASQTQFVDGRTSNPHNTTKINAVARTGDLMAQKASKIAVAALERSRQVTDFVIPRRIAEPSLCCYGAGMQYGPHVDAAYLPIDAQGLRSDVSCTIFISDPASYQGGELVSHIGSEEIRVKGRPGSAVFYPSTTLHEVLPILSGERLVLITFIESRIPDQLQRDLIYSINEVRALEGLKMDWRNRIRLEYTLVNLLRMWSR